MTTLHRSYRRTVVGCVVAVALACGAWWVVRQGWYAEVVLISAQDAGAALTIDGEPVAPSAVRDSGEVTFSTYHPPVGTRRLVVRDAETVLLDAQAELEPQTATTYVLFCGGGRWLAEHDIHYSNVPGPDLSAFDSGSQTTTGRVVDVDGQETSFLSRTDDAAGVALLESLGTRIHTSACLLDYWPPMMLWPWEEIPDSVTTEGGRETLHQLRVLSLDEVTVAQRLRAAADEDERNRAAARAAAEGFSDRRAEDDATP